MLLELWRNRQGCTAGAQGLDGLETLLGDGAEKSHSDDATMGDFEADGLDDIAGLASSPGIGILGLSDIGGLLAPDMEPVRGLEGDEALLVMDGLGRVKRARVRRGRKGRGGSNSKSYTSQTTPSAPAPGVQTQSSVRNLELNVPLNTLRNLFKLRRMALKQMASSGRPVISGYVLSSVDGLAVSFGSRARMCLR